MKLPRRRVLQGSAAMALSSLAPWAAQADQDADMRVFLRGISITRSNLLNFFPSKGYREGTSLPIVTGRNDFNGGLRYDDSDIPFVPRQMVVQACARVEDIAEKQRDDVLPLFHIFRCDRIDGDPARETLDQLLERLTLAFEFTPERIGFVSVPAFAALRPVVERYDIRWSRQVFLRDLESARAAGDGSGHFRHPSGEHGPGLATVGVYYWMGDGTPGPLRGYPPTTGWIEIAEAAIEDDSPLAFSIGLERLFFNIVGFRPSWNAQVARLLERIDRDSASGQVPPGRQLFAES